MIKSYLRKFLIVLGFVAASTAVMAQKSISGTVKTAEDGEPLIGATVLIKGTSKGAITDLDGAFTIEANNGDILVISFAGMLSQEISIGSSSTIEVSMEEDVTSLSDVVVTATNQPIRKLETTTAVSIIGKKLLETTRPEGFAEAVQGTPGMYTSQSQGRFRGAIFTRGFPDGSGNGLVYTGILIDGLPSLATTARPPDFAFGFDPNIDRIEVVRGSAATLFGRASAAGVVNIISKVGGDELSGLFRVTHYNENVDSRNGFDYKVEGNLNGPVTKNLYFNVGGFYVDDRGFRDLGYNDRGGQIRANLDYMFDNDKGSIRLFGSYNDMTIQNMIDIPYRLSDNTPLDGWDITDSYWSENLENYTHPTINQAVGIPSGNYQITDRNGNPQNRSFQQANEDGNYARGGNFGLFVNYEVADWLIVSNKFRYQDYDHGTKFNLGVSPFYFGDASDPSAPSNLRVFIDGDGNDQDVMNELRFTIPVEIGSSKHNFNVGSYISRGNYTPETYSWLHQSSADPNNPVFGFFGPPGATPPPFGSIARRGDYQITAYSVFVGDEMKFNGTTTVNVGFRYDEINMDIEGFFNNPNLPTDSETNPADIQREENHSDYSFSLGVNHLLSTNTSVYGNFVSAFRMPDYSAYTPADPASLVENPRIEDNERVTNIELGYRSNFGDLGLDVAGFYTNIDNRLATVYEGAIAVQRPLGTNRIIGGELALTYAPTAVKGLLFRTSYTYQNATFQDFKIAVENADPDGESFGNKFVLEGQDENDEDVYSIDLKGKQIPRVPAHIFNFLASYDKEYFGANAALNYFARRYADPTNLFQQDDIANLNLGVYGKYNVGGGNIKLSVLVKNVINTDKALRFLYVADNDQALARQQAIDAGTASAEDTYYTGIPFLPRRVLVSLAYEF